MEIVTKFNNDDKVYTIRKKNEIKWNPCEFCDGKGTIIGRNGELGICPECNGRRGKQSLHDLKWFYSEIPLTIGQVRVCVTGKYTAENESVFSNYGSQQYKYEEKYMLRETGIHSGSVWKVENLFSTLEEAKEECDKRNAE